MEWQQLKEALLAQIEDQGLSSRTVYFYRHTLDKVDVFLNERSITVYKVEHGEEFFREWAARNNPAETTERYARVVIKRLDDLLSPKKGFIIRHSAETTLFLEAFVPLMNRYS